MRPWLRRESRVAQEAVHVVPRGRALAQERENSAVVAMPLRQRSTHVLYETMGHVLDTVDGRHEEFGQIAGALELC